MSRSNLDGNGKLRFILIFIMIAPFLLSFINFFLQNICSADGIFSWVCWPTFDVSYDPINFTLEEVGKVVKKIIDAIKSIPIIGEIISFVEDAVDAALAAIFKFIGVELPSWKIDLPFIDRLEQLAQKAAGKAEEFMEYFENVLNLDGKLSALVEPIIEPVLDAIPTIDLDCDGNETEILLCSFDKLGINVELDVDEISGMEISGIDLLPDTGIIDVLQGFLENAENIGNHLSDLFEDDGVACRQYETVPFDLIDQLETHLNISRNDIPVAICPINFEMCTDLVLPQVDTFVGKMNDELSSTLQRKNRALEVNNTDHSRSLLSYFTCDAKWAFGETDKFVDWGASITFPLLKEIKLPLISDRNQALFRKVFRSKYLNKLSVTMNSKLSGLTTVRFLIGCKEGEFQFYLETLPLLEVDLNWRYLEERKGDEYRFFSQEENNQHFPRNIGPTKDFRPTKDAIQTFSYLQGPNPDLAKFNREMYLVEILNKILCHLDYMHVNDVIGADSVLIPKSNYNILIRWLNNYGMDWRRPGGGPAMITIGEIIRDLGTKVGDVQKWEFQERVLSRLQAKAYESRKTMNRNIAKLGMSPIVPPGDKLGRQKSCRDLYGYDLRPGSLRDYFTEVVTDSFQSITYSATNFRKARWGARGTTLPYRKQRRTIDFGLRDSHASPFDLKFLLIGILINSGPLLAVLGVDSLAVLGRFLGLSVLSLWSLIFDEPTVQPTTSPTTSKSPSGVIPLSSSPSSSPTTLGQQVLRRFAVLAQVLLLAFPPIEMRQLISLFRILSGTALPPVKTRNLSSVFDVAFLNYDGINPDKPLAEQEVSELQIGSALSTSVNLVRNDPDEEGWKGSKDLKSRYCKDRFCIYLWTKDPYFTEQCYPGQVGFCPYETVILPDGIV